MGAIQNYSFNDFINAIKNQLGQESAEKIEQNSSKFKSIFDIAARSDGGENAEILEEDYQGFKNLVDSTVVAFNNMFEKGKDALKQMEFIPGNSKTKENGALSPDKIKEYENGDLVRIVTGFDENGDGQLTGNEVDTDLTAGNWRTKQNGALTPDVVKEYENGKLVKEKEGFDENENGWIDDKNEQ